MTTPSHPPRILLKILSGVHVGAEVELGLGEYPIGRDEACELVLLDRDIAPRHAILTLAEGTATLRALDGQLTGQTTPTDPITVIWFQVFSLGSVHLVLGPANAPWPPLSAIDLTPLSALPDSPPQKTVEPAAEILPATLPESPPPVVPVLASHSWHPYWLRGLIGLLLLAVLVQFVWPLFYAPLVPPAPSGTHANKTATTPLDRLRERLTSQGWQDLRLDTRITPPALLGYVPRLVDLQTLKRMLEETGLRITNRVTASEALVETAAAVLRSQGHSLKVAGQGPGRIVVTGITEQPEELTRDLAALKQDLSALREIENRTEVRQDPVRILSQWIKAAGLTQIELVHFADRILARGQPDAKARQIFEELATRYAKAFPNLPLLAEFPPFPKPPKSALPGIIGVMMGSHRFLLTDDNRSLGEGQILAPGVVIEQIAFDHVILAANGERQKLLIPTPPQRD
ncbi:MAG: type III secretion system inner membrane ring subunit SctD [Pseudomonadota bacterium]